MHHTERLRNEIKRRPKFARLEILLPPGQKHKLQVLADFEGVAVAELVRRVFSVYFRRERRRALQEAAFIEQQLKEQEGDNE